MYTRDHAGFINSNWKQCLCTTWKCRCQKSDDNGSRLCSCRREGWGPVIATNSFILSPSLSLSFSLSLSLSLSFSFSLTLFLSYCIGSFFNFSTHLSFLSSLFSSISKPDTGKNCTCLILIDSMSKFLIRELELGCRDKEKKVGVRVGERK
jgi:hypothetical protein